MLSSWSVGATSVTNGTVVGWGDDRYGYYAVPPGLTDVVAVASGSLHNLALRRDGRVVTWGQSAAAPADLTNVVAVAAGGDFSLALKSDGTVAGWGNNSAGQISIPAGLTNVIAIAAGEFHSVALRQDGTVACWGHNSSGQSTPPTNLSDIVAVAAGRWHTLALKGDGTVVGWGENRWGESAPPAGLDDVVTIASGESRSAAVLSNGTVVAWGTVSAGTNTTNRFPASLSIPPGLSNVVSVALGYSFTVALRRDSTVLAWGDGTAGQTNAPFGLSNVVAIAAGGSHSLALVSNLPNPPLIVAQPQDQLVALGFDAGLMVEAWGSGGLSYQWRQGTTDVQGATASLLVVSNVTADAAGGYSVVVGNPYGSVTSAVANIFIDAAPVHRPYLVTNSRNLGPGTLRQAIFDANAVGGGTILFSNVTGVIQLGSMFPALRGDTSIVGPGTNLLVLTGYQLPRALSLEAGSTCSISGLTFSLRSGVKTASSL